MMRYEKGRKSALLLGTLVILAIAGAALVLFSTLEKAGKPAWEGGYSVHISEVMTRNTTCPNEAGQLLDWVELSNTSAGDFDLGGYFLSDTPGEGKYLIPAGTVVPAHGMLVIWCDPDGEGENIAPFGLRSEGGETVCLMNANLVSVDEALTVPTENGQSLVRASDGGLVPSDSPSPGFPNDETGARAWQEVLSRRAGGTLSLSEIMSSNSLYAAPDGSFCDWVEVYNPTDKPVALSGYKLSDREEKTKYSLPDSGVLAPWEYRVFWCAPDGYEKGYAPFGISSKGGETVVLTGPTGTPADSVEVPALEKNSSYIKTASGWQVNKAPTPGFPNDEAGAAAYRLSLGFEETDVYITEVMDGNKAVCADEDGDFSDWIELGNLGTAPAELTGWYLSDQEDLPNKWAIPSLTLRPGECVRIWASGKNRTTGESLHTDFALSAGDTVSLSTPNGVRMRYVNLSEDTKGDSLILSDDGGFIPCDTPTPGYSNDAAGYAAFCESDGRSAPLLIWEAVTYDPDRSDWVELKNVSDSDVNLSAYTLTDRKSDPGRMALPDTVLSPGQSQVLELNGFGLSVDGDELYLFDAAGRALDWARLRNVPRTGSYGRKTGENGFFYFDAKTPGAEPVGGWRLVAQAPTADVAPGAYNGVDSLTVTLRGENIYYTTDGSTPTAASTAYTGPLTLTQTTVLRAVSLPGDRMPGEAVTLGYFLNESSTLPILSLVTDRANLFGPQGIYDHHETAWEKKWEREASIALYEEGEEGFTIDCGIRIHGRTSRRASEKRSFLLKFRGRYDGDLKYDLFGDGKVTDFSSLVLRGSLEDNYTSYMRDELFAALAMENTDVPAANYKYVSLFINGEYWGIYALREHHSTDYFASHYGVDKDTVDMQTGEYYGTTAWNDIVHYAMDNPGAWDYMQQHVDIPVMIDWLILECWGGDYDVYENVRFYASPDYENGKYLYGLHDMDLTMMLHDTYDVGFARYGQPHMYIPASLLGVPEFRDQFLTRLGELLRGPLSEEAVMAKIGELRAIVEPESARDLQRWGKDPNTFNAQMSNIKNFVEGRTAEMVNSAAGYFGLSAEQIQKYFG